MIHADCGGSELHPVPAAQSMFVPSVGVPSSCSGTKPPKILRSQRACTGTCDAQERGPRPAGSLISTERTSLCCPVSAGCSSREGQGVSSPCVLRVCMAQRRGKVICCDLRTCLRVLLCFPPYPLPLQYGIQNRYQEMTCQEKNGSL